MEEINVRVEDNERTVETALQPMIYASWLCGVGVARPRTIPKTVTIVLRVGHFAVCSVIVAYGAIDFFTFGNVFKSDIFKIMYYTNKVACYASSYYYVVHGIRHYDKWPELMDRLRALDRRIKRETAIDDRAITKWQTLAFATAVALGPVSLVIHALYYYFTLPEDIFASDLLLYYTIAQSLVNSFVFDLIVYVVYRRFRTINGLIERSDEGLAASWVALRIRRARELHKDVCDLVTTVNDVHGVHLLLCSANCFTMVVATLFRIYMGVVERNYEFMMINNVIWMIYAGQIAATCLVCTSACRESARTGSTIHAVSLKRGRSAPSGKTTSLGDEPSPRSQIRDETPGSGRFDPHHFTLDAVLRANLERDCVRNEVNDFSAQLLQNRVAFTACDFFEMNNSLLSGFIGVITTYLIILVQFYRPENPEAARYNKKR